MKTKQTIRYGALAVMFALAFNACDDGSGTGDGGGGGGGGGHTHTYSTEWSFNATQHWYECTAGDGAKKGAVKHDGDPCTECHYDSNKPLVTFSKVTADGGARATTTTLTLTLSEAITGLTATDITLSGVTGVQKGTLSGTGSTYTLPISGFTAGGTLTVAVAAKTGYNISGSPKTVTIYYYTPGGGGGGMNWTAVADSTFGSGETISGIAYGGNKFVAVGSNGKMAYSTNGTTWTPVENDAVSDSGFGATAINAIAYGGGKFVAGGNNGKMAYSSNGETWTPVADSKFGTTDIRAIAYGGGKFVAVGLQTMAYSTDGVIWTAVNNYAFTNWNDILAIAYGGNKFVVGGGVNDDSKMGYSADGVSWTTVADSTFRESRIWGIAYGGGKFVAGGYNGEMAYSADGITWTAVADSTFGILAYIRGIAYGNNRFVAVGYSQSGSYPNYTYTGKMAYSANGTTWTAVANDAVSDSGFGTTAIRAIAFGGGKFVAVGGGGKMAYSN